MHGEIFLVSCKFIQLSVKHRLLVNVFLAASFDSKFEPLSGHFHVLVMMDMHLISTDNLDIKYPLLVYQVTNVHFF